MMRQVCSPRIGCRFFVRFALVLLSSTCAFAHNPQTSDLADNPAVAAQLQSGQGKAAQLDGELEIVHQDFPDGHGRFVFTLKQADGTRVPMQFAKHPPTHLLTGDHVRTNGRILNGNLLLYSGNTNLQKTGGGSGGGPTTPSIPVPNTFGVQSVLVILVNFQDDVIEPYTVSDAQNAFFVSANNFFLENSYGQTYLTGNVVGWYTIPESVTTCNTSQIATDAQSAATAAGVNLANYTRFVYMFPQDNACGFGGASSVGGNPSQSWINGTTGAGGTTLDLHVIDHELGHAFGLWHSHLYDCDTAATVCSNPSIDEYGDILDTMGPPQPISPHYHAFQKERLGWLNYGASPSIQTVTSSGTYTVNPYEIGGVGPNALKILKSTDSTTGAKTWYYIEARQAIGFDAFLTDGTRLGQNETGGVLFHVGTDNDGDTGDLLDMTPATLTYYFWFDPSLAVGQNFSDSGAGVTFATESATAAGATVNVQFSGNGSGTNSTTGTPVLAVATNQTTYTPGQTVSVSATATSGGVPLANVSVKFAVTSSTGGQITGSATTGKNGVAMYKLRLKQSAPAGTYNAGAAATVQSNALKASAAFTVQ
jgi:M6 family metalloprotease-like protein